MRVDVKKSLSNPFTDSGTNYEESVEMVDTSLEKTHWNVSGEID